MSFPNNISYSVSSSAFILVPENSFAYFQELLSIQESGEIECKDYSTNIKLRIDDSFWLVLSSKAYVLRQSGKCYSALVSGTNGRWRIGTALFKEYYTLFDRGNERVGFRNLRDFSTCQNDEILEIGC